MRGATPAVSLSGTARDDRVLAATRALSLFIAPFLVLGFGILYLFPDHTRELFAWTIKPRLTAMMLGAAYLGGTYFFLRAARASAWHRVHAGFPPIAVFASLLGVTTILHWGRFNHGHPAFVTWAALYFTTPFLVIAAWVRNRTRDPRAPDADDRALPAPVRLALGGVGAVLLAVAALLFLRPDVAIQLWPWTLTPLTARVVASLFALAGAAEISVASDWRWSAARVTLQSQLIALLGIELAAVLAWGDLRPANPLRWLFAGGLLLLLTGLLLLWGLMDWPRRLPAPES